MNNLAFSYIRFSSIKQELGDSLRRQLKLAEDYAARHHLTLDTSSFRDLGISAFKGKNQVEGALGAFLEAINTGKIPKGSTLLVESLDRLSRDHVDTALELFLSITNRGIKIVTLQDEQSYSKESIRENWTKLIIALATMARAHEESSTKSLRIKAAWQKKRDSGEILTSVCPAWLKRNGDKWDIIPEKAEVVRRVFQLAYDGNGGPSIARIFNEEKVPTMGWSVGWTAGPIHCMLNNESVLGTFTPKKADAPQIKGYYPAIVDETVFNEVRARVASRKWAGGRNTVSVSSLFSGMSFCAKCGTKMRYVSGGGGYLYLRCLSAYSGQGCDEGKFPYLAAEQTILSKFHAQNRDLAPKITEVPEDQSLAIELKITEHKKKIDNLVMLAEATGDISAVAKRIADVSGIISALEKDLKSLKVVDADMHEATQLKRWYSECETLEGDERVKLRLQIQATIRRFVEKVDFDATKKTLTIHYKSGKVRVEDCEKFLLKRGFQPGNIKGKR